MYNEETIKEVINLLAENEDIASISQLLNIPPAIITSWQTKYQEEIKFYGVSKEIKQLINLGQYKEALKLCDKPELVQKPVIMSQKITILIKLKKLKKALAICNEPSFQHNPIIMSQKVTIYVKLHDQDAALAICNRPEFANNEYIQKQKALILIYFGEFQQAFNICNKPEFQNCTPIQDLKAMLLQEYPELNNNSTIINSPKLYEDILTLLKNKKLSLEELNNYPLSDLAKSILTLAYHELQNYPQNVSLNFLKKLQKEYHDNELALKIITKLLNHFKSKRNIFNFEFYLELLSTPIEITPIINTTEERELLLRLINILNTIKEECLNNENHHSLKH